MTLLPLNGGFALTLTRAELRPFRLTPADLTHSNAAALLRALCRAVKLPVPPHATVELFAGREEALLFLRPAPSPRPPRPKLLRGRVRRRT